MKYTYLQAVNIIQFVVLTLPGVHGYITANPRRWTIADSILVHRLRHWPTIYPTIAQHLVLAGYCAYVASGLHDIHSLDITLQTYNERPPYTSLIRSIPGMELQIGSRGDRPATWLNVWWAHLDQAPANTWRYLTCPGLMLGQRLRRWPNIKQGQFEFLVFSRRTPYIAQTGIVRAQYEANFLWGLWLSPNSPGAAASRLWPAVRYKHSRPL